ncbi:hypothetical protein [Aquabacterium sp.]|uniref:hypothetical protein n=1 Tax=Aquabacterium sp. TaxID=1872578 RepID=UPI00260F511B|nr:hypothetical protein [Aquabacterium sp.]MDD2976092.1 hypothetical protein [Aquabacterium sp.]
MSNKKSAPMVGQRSKVSAIRPPANEIEPHEGWVLHSKFGYMGRDNTPAGRLVRLVDLEWWLSERRGIPRAEVIRLIANVMRDTPEAIEQSLFQLQPGDYAQPLRPMRQKAIGIKLPAGDEAEWLRVVGMDDSTSVNFELAVQRLEDESQRRAKVSDERKAQEAAARIARTLSPVPRVDPMDYLAILMTTANELWGYGRAAAHSAETAGVASTPKDTVPDVSTWAGLVKLRQANPGCDWTDEMKKTVAREDSKRRQKPGDGKVRVGLAGELPDDTGKPGISVTRLGKLVRDGQALLEEEKQASLRANGSVFHSR